MAVSITHQGISLLIGALFVGPYITCVIKYMGLLQGTDRMRIVGGFAVMSLETLRSMGMLYRVQTARGIKYRVRQSTALTTASDVPQQMMMPLPYHRLLPPHAIDPIHHLMPWTILLILQQHSSGCKEVSLGSLSSWV